MPKSKIKCNKGQCQLNMQAVSLVFSMPPKILPAGGTKACPKPNLINNKCKCIHEKIDSKECKTKLKCRIILLIADRQRRITSKL